jgi:hypothetical protein
MGLFSRTKTQVGTQVQRVIDDARLPTSVINGITKNLFEDDSDGTQMVEYILEELTNNIGIRANRMYAYGRDEYVYGLPKSSYRSSLQAKNAVQQYLNGQEGGAVGMTYYNYGAMNLVHYAFHLLTTQFDWLPESNNIGKLTAQKNRPVSLVDIQVYVTDITPVESTNGSLDVWTPAPNSYANMSTLLDGSVLALKKANEPIVEVSASNDYAIIKYAFEETYTVTVEGVPTNKKRTVIETMRLELTGFDVMSDYHQARYTKPNGMVKYWFYKQNDGIAAIDTVMDASFNGDGSFFPWGYMRFNKKSLVSNKTSEAYKSSKKLFGLLNMDYDMVAEAINENPDIADVEQAMMVMGVPAGSEDQIDQQYLFDFFDKIQLDTNQYGNNLGSIAAQLIARKLNKNTPETSIIIQDKQFKMALAFKNLSKQELPGSVSAVGKYSSEVGGDMHKYRYQHTDGMYYEIVVTDLKMTYWVFDKYTTTGDEDNKEILLIPVDVNIAKTYALPFREKLYARSMHFVFNSRVVTKLKWYQTGIFRLVMIVASVVITVLSLGSTWQSIVAAIGAGATVGAVAMMVLMAILKYIVVSIALKLFVKVVGARLAFIVAVVAAVYGGYQAIKAGSLNGTPWAKELLQVSSGLSSAVNADLASQMEDLVNEQSEFQKFVQDQTKLLDSAKEMLGGDVVMNPLIIFGESPNDFYQRTVHSGNIGVVGIEAVSSYVDMALRLPEISETLT